MKISMHAMSHDVFRKALTQLLFVMEKGVANAKARNFDPNVFVSQRLAPKVGGGRQLITEILGHNLRTKETVALGEGEHRSFYEIIEASSPFGWLTFDQSVLNAYEKGYITQETAKLFASRKGKVSRGIDLIQKARGVHNEVDSGLHLDLPANAFR